MIELDYWDERRGTTIARVSARDPATIPAAGDTVYIPGAEQAGIYVHLRVTLAPILLQSRGSRRHDPAPCEVLQ